MRSRKSMQNSREHMEPGGHGGILLWRGIPTWLLSASQWIRCLTEMEGKFDEYSEELWWCAYESWPRGGRGLAAGATIQPPAACQRAMHPCARPPMPAQAVSQPARGARGPDSP
eukprot:COSAG05_NODE_839_length_7033_cov_12.960485_6_plen_114_part_00